MTVLDCEQCNGTGECKPGVRCPCREEDDEATERRSRMGIAPKCPFASYAMRPELAEPPSMMHGLPIDKRGYPVPWFVDWINGEPEFRAMDRRKFVRAVNEKLCWVCGKQLYEEKIFTIGPMCAVNRISSEPPSHRECARYSALNCPFLSRPHMVRREDERIDKKLSSGLMVERNPGVTLLWFTRRFTTKNVDAIPSAGANAGVLFELGKPFKTEWYKEGREATRAEILESINSGLPIFHELNRKQAGADEDWLAEMTANLDKQVAEAMRLVPR